MTHRSEVMCLPHAGIVLRCFQDLEDRPHWTVRMGHAPMVVQIVSAWEYHLQQEKEDRDG